MTTRRPLTADEQAIVDKAIAFLPDLKDIKDLRTRNRAIMYPDARKEDLIPNARTMGIEAYLASVKESIDHDRNRLSDIKDILGKLTAVRVERMGTITRTKTILNKSDGPTYAMPADAPSEDSVTMRLLRSVAFDPAVSQSLINSAAETDEQRAALNDIFNEGPERYAQILKIGEDDIPALTARSKGVFADIVMMGLKGEDIVRVLTAGHQKSGGAMPPLQDFGGRTLFSMHHQLVEMFGSPPYTGMRFIDRKEGEENQATILPDVVHMLLHDVWLSPRIVNALGTDLQKAKRRPRAGRVVTIDFPYTDRVLDADPEIDPLLIALAREERHLERHIKHLRRHRRENKL